MSAVWAVHGFLLPMHLLEEIDGIEVKNSSATAIKPPCSTDHPAGLGGQWPGSRRAGG